MSLEATVWALKFAPPMPPQILGTLIGLAEHADARGRGAYPSVPTLAAYTCKADRSVRRDIKELLALGLIRRGDQSLAARLPAGKRPEVYDLAVELTVPGGRAGDDEVTLASRVTLASSRARGGKKKPSSDEMSSTLWGDADVRGDVGVRGDAHVHDDLTPTSQRGDAHVTQTTHEPSVEPKDSSAPAALEAFGAFWLIYPKKRDREAAKKAWLEALKRGATAEHITAAAQAYARERAQQDPKYTKYPATWLNKGCYDDEPEAPARPQLRAVGDYQPWTNPADQSAYYDSL